MFDILTIEPSDKTVMAAVNLIASGNTKVLPHPNGNCRVIALNAVHTNGDGGAASATLCIVGHADADELSEQKTWGAFVNSVTANVKDWQTNKKTVYIVACSTAAEDGTKFLHGNIANEIKTHFPGATVWASDTAVGVSADGLTGTWVKL